MGVGTALFAVAIPACMAFVLLALHLSPLDPNRPRRRRRLAFHQRVGAAGIFALEEAEGVNAMRCLLCDQEMKLVRVEPHELIDLAGFERHTYECPACKDTEERMVFNRVEGREAVVEAPETAQSEPA